MNFDNNQAADMSGARRDGVWEGTEAYGVGHNGAGRSAQFDGASRIAVPALVGMQWGNALSVSCFFRRTGEFPSPPKQLSSSPPVLLKKLFL